MGPAKSAACVRKLALQDGASRRVVVTGMGLVSPLGHEVRRAVDISLDEDARWLTHAISAASVQLQNCPVCIRLQNSEPIIVIYKTLKAVA